MKKNFILIASLVSSLSFAQHFCGFDEVQKELDRKFPENKERREKLNRELAEKGTNEILREYGFSHKIGGGDLIEMSNSNASSTAYQGTIYEIPVVVHVIESNDASNTKTKLTDEEIQKWIDNANKMYATTYGNGFFAEGDGSEGGAVIPFKLVLAKRTPDCQVTNGVIRYNGSNITNYNAQGMKRGNGGNGGEIKALAPHWPENAYYNIYVVIGFDGNKEGHGLMGWAYGPESDFSSYETVMKAAVVKKNNDVTLAHEFGHALGLAHPFHPANGQGGQCPKNDDCTIDNDGVCDTEPTQSLVTRYIAPTSSEINPCTNVGYQGVQYNIMNYTPAPKKFTAGQRDRALALFLSQKGILTRSLGATPPSSTSKNLNLTPMSCSISNTNNPNANYSVGVTGVKIGNINNETGAYANKKFYQDFTLDTCTGIYYTDIEENKETSLTVSKNPLNGFPIIVWIDYNDNGVFEDSEKVLRQRIDTGQSSYTKNITPPSDAVKGKYLRMRVKGDWPSANVDNPCANLTYGEVEDYAIRIVPKDFVDPDTPTNPNDPSDPNNPNREAYFGRVGINTDQPQVTLDVRETALDLLPKGAAQGVSFPNFTTEQRATFQNVAEGTMIFNTTLKCLEIYTGTVWKCIQ